MGFALYFFDMKPEFWSSYEGTIMKHALLKPNCKNL